MSEFYLGYFVVIFSWIPSRSPWRLVWQRSSRWWKGAVAFMDRLAHTDGS